MLLSSVHVGVETEISIRRVFETTKPQRLAAMSYYNPNPYNANLAPLRLTTAADAVIRDGAVHVAVTITSSPCSPNPAHPPILHRYTPNRGRYSF
jgi:hypothetical protein